MTDNPMRRNVLPWKLAWAVLLLAGCSNQIQHGLTEPQANEVQRVLSERGIRAKKVAEGGKKPSWAIEVASEDSSDALLLVTELGLPKAKPVTTLEVLGNGSLVPSNGEERAKLLVGLAGDLSQTLESVEGVLSARVHLVAPVPPRPGQAAGRPRASVLLRLKPGAGPRVSVLREDLRALVAGSVENLSVDDVTLVLDELAPTVAARPVQRREGLLATTQPRTLVGLGLFGLGGFLTVAVSLGRRRLARGGAS